MVQDKRGLHPLGKGSELFAYRPSLPPCERPSTRIEEIQVMTTKNENGLVVERCKVRGKVFNCDQLSLLFNSRVRLSSPVIAVHFQVDYSHKLDVGVFCRLQVIEFRIGTQAEKASRMAKPPAESWRQNLSAGLLRTVYEDAGSTGPHYSVVAYRMIGPGKMQEAPACHQKRDRLV
jgi:hypothetical protein